MATIKGIEGMTPEELYADIQRGGKFVTFPYCVSVLVLTFRNNSDVYYVRAGQSVFVKALPYVLLTLLFGWWGFPWGIIWTPVYLFRALAGGTDVTGEVMGAMQVGPQNPWAAGS